MLQESVKENNELTLDYRKDIQKMKFNIVFLMKSSTLKSNLLNFTMEYKND